jgi:ATP-dependent protease HslVU (ClpYQ) peptidase subunit
VTVIAAVPSPDGVFIATDSQLTRGANIVAQVAKVVTKTAGDAEVLIAVAGSYRLFSLACHALQLSDAPNPDDERSCDSWAHAVAVALAELAAEAKPPVLDDGQVDGEALLAFDRHLWLLNGQSAIRMDKPCAIGSGSPEARGALHAVGAGTERHVDPAWALAVAVQAAIDLDPNCGGQVVLVKTQADRSGQDQ